MEIDLWTAVAVSDPRNGKEGGGLDGWMAGWSGCTMGKWPVAMMAEKAGNELRWTPEDRSNLFFSVHDCP